ncbi:MAG: hypothetical protein ACI8TA_002451 [Cyclobacteriaceae bacterium]|jgi:hypothetical protein
MLSKTHCDPFQCCDFDMKNDLKYTLASPKQNMILL